jgi:general secretion pathway protein E
MNLAEAPDAWSGLTFSPEQVREARAAAGLSRRPVLAVLEERSGLDPGGFVQVLAATFRYPAVAMADLHRMTPAFDVLPFAEALERECLALRDEDGALTLIMGDPFDVALQSWAEQRIPARFAWRLAHPADVAAYLARHEETMHAMDSVLPAGDTVASSATGAEDLSFKPRSCSLRVKALIMLVLARRVRPADLSPRPSIPSLAPLIS